MAYSRWNEHVYNVFWHIQVPTWHNVNKHEQSLAVWHKSERYNNPVFMYLEVKEMLDSERYDKLPGFYTEKEEEQRNVVECMKQWVKDMDAYFSDGC